MFEQQSDVTSTAFLNGPVHLENSNSIKYKSCICSHELYYDSASHSTPLMWNILQDHLGFANLGTTQLHFGHNVILSTASLSPLSFQIVQMEAGLGRRHLNQLCWCWGSLLVRIRAMKRSEPHEEYKTLEGNAVQELIFCHTGDHLEIIFCHIGILATRIHSVLCSRIISVKICSLTCHKLLLSL